MEKFTDKDLHCIARNIQLGRKNMQCLYCKYATECGSAFEKDRTVYFMDGELAKKLEKMTGVQVTTPHLGTAYALKESWIKPYPGLMDKIKDLPLDEQKKILEDPNLSVY